MSEINVGVLTINGICADDNMDEIGFFLIQMIRGGILGDVKHIKTCSVSEDLNEVKDKLTKWDDSKDIQLILTLEGTEKACRGIAKEATTLLVKTHLPGILKMMELSNVDKYICGITENTLIVNLPYCETSSRRNLKLIAKDVIYVIRLFWGSEQREVHKKGVKDLCMERKNAQGNIMSTASLLQKVADLNINVASDFVLARNVEIIPKFPPFAISKVKGYAVLSSDIEKQKMVVGDCEVGTMSTCTVMPGTCVSVQEGTAIPEGVDCVVEAKDVLLKNNFITVDPKSVGKYKNIIQMGSLPAGTLLNEYFISKIEATGKDSVEVYSKPSVAVVCFPNLNVQLRNLVEFEGFQCKAVVVNNNNNWYDSLEKCFLLSDVVVTTPTDFPILDVMINDFHAFIITTKVEEEIVYFSTIIINGEPKLWYGFPTQTIHAAEFFLIPTLFYISGKGWINQSRKKQLDEKPEGEENGKLNHIDETENGDYEMEKKAEDGRNQESPCASNIHRNTRPKRKRTGGRKSLATFVIIEH